MPLRSGALDNGTLKGKTALSLISNKVDPTLVLDSPFSEGAGNVARDRSLYGNHGAIYGASWVNRALSFDGINDYVRAPFPSQLEGNQPHTIEFWIYMPTPILGYSIINLGVPTTPGPFFIRIWSEASSYPRRLWRGFDMGGTTWLAPVPPVDAWFHLAEVYDSVASTSKMYYNGSLVQTGANVYPHTGHLTAGYVDIGLAIAGWSYFKGLMKKVRIYNRVLGLSEIQLRYKEG